MCIAESGTDSIESKYNKKLVLILDTILLDDQNCREKMDKIAEKYGWSSDTVKVLWKIINKKDSVNLQKVVKILDEHGWLGPDSIGEDGNQTLFLVIQHANHEIQNKYLIVMREAVKKGNANSSDLAYLEDRVALDNGEEQIYGTQLGVDETTGHYYVLPLIDPENVDKRRADMGLEPMNNYLSYWGLKWNAKKYQRHSEKHNSK